MRKIIFYSIVIFFTSILSAADLTRYVDPFICSAGDHGQLDPSANVPFGMIKLGPQTLPGGHTGYDYNAKEISGFTHTRLMGVGCSGAGGVLLTKPGLGEPNADAVEYLKNSETATPGYYAVKFTNGIQAEMTINQHVGLQRFTFPQSDKSFIMIDPASSIEQVLSSEYKIKSNREITGRITARNNCKFGMYTNYYVITFDKAFDSVEEKDGKVFLVFSLKQNDTVNMSTALSPLSVEQAREDLYSALQNKSFDTVKAEAQQAWEKIFERVVVEGKEEYKTLFYTHLYHSSLSPFNSTSSSGTYRGTDNKIYKAEGYTHYDSWSIWDTFRTKFPLVTLLEPGLMRDFCLSLVDLYNTGLTYQPSNSEPIVTCRTEHASIVLLDAWKKGIPFDLKAVYPKLVEETKQFSTDSPDKKLEAAYDYWGLAEIAKIVGNDADYVKYSKMAGMYKDIWVEKFKVMNENADIMHGDGLYEGTLWQYRWFVPQDISGLLELFEGKDNYTQDLTYFYENDLYNHGNQPDIHVPFMFAFSNSPWLSQKWVNEILTKETKNYYGTHVKWDKPFVGRIYNTSPQGYIPEMDDDDGTMSAWYVFAAMGLYPYCVGKPEYVITTPIFDNIKIDLENGNPLEIKTKNFSDENYYIQSVTFNGKKINSAIITHEQLMEGGVLEYELGNKPNTKLFK